MHGSGVETLRSMKSSVLIGRIVCIAWLLFGVSGVGRAQQVAVAVPAPVPDARAEAFDAFLKAVQRDPGGMARDAMLKGLALGRELGRPNSAAAVAKLYLNQTPAPAPEIVLATAEAAAMAGDFRTAAGRYKQYLGVAPASPASSAIAATLYTILLDYLNSPDETFRFMDESGERLRQDLAARKFDGWFVQAARNQRNYRALSRRLAVILADGLPLSMERHAYWGHIDWLMGEVAYSRPEMFEALPHLRQIVERLRDNPVRKARYNYLIAHMTYRANSAGKDAEGVMKEFEPALTAARAYFDAVPQPDTFEEIFRTWMGGPGQWSVDWYNKTPTQCRTLLAYAFDRVDDAGRTTMLNRYVQHGWLATFDDWKALGLKYPEVFKRNWTTSLLSFNWQVNDLAFHKSSATFLQGVPSLPSAIVSSLASSDDFWAAVQHMVQQYSWFMEPQQPREMMHYMWSCYANFPRPETAKLAPDLWENTQARFAREYILLTPMVMNRDVARDTLAVLWRQPEDRLKFVGWLQALDWVPFSADDRKHVLGGAYDQFQNWINWARQNETNLKNAQAAVNNELAQAKTAREATTKALQDNAKAKTDAQTGKQQAQAANDAGKVQQMDAQLAQLTQQETEAKTRAQQQDAQLADLTRKLDEATKALTVGTAEVAKISPLEVAFRTAQAVTGDPAKGPTPLCQALSRATLAVNSGNLNEYLAAARAAYPLVRTYESQKTPLGAWCLRWLVANRLDKFDTIDFQCEVLADQYQLYIQNGMAGGVHAAMGTLCSGRQGWNGWCSMRAQDRDAAKKLNDVLAKAMQNQTSRDLFWGDLFTWFRNTRTFEGGKVEHAWNPEVYEQLILKRTFFKHTGFRPDTASATMAYIWLVRNECNVLDAKYPVASWFDAMYADEVRATKLPESRFWDYSPDTEKKAVTAVIEIFGAQAGYPLGDEALRPAMDRDNYWNVMWRVHERSTPEARAALYAKYAAQFGQTRFDDYASGVHGIGGFAVDKPEERKAFFERVNAYLDRVASLPWRSTPPPLGAVAVIPHEQAATVTDAELDILVRAFRAPPYTWPAGWNIEHTTLLLQNALVTKGRFADIFSITPQCWKVYRDNRNGQYWEWMAGVAARIADAGQPELATVHAGIGLNMLGLDLQENVRNTLMAVRSKAMASVGGAIPVERGDRRYPVFAAQADYLFGKFETAWAQYLPQRDLLRSIMKELDPGFVLWVIQRHTDVGDYKSAEDVARDMLTWVSGSPQGFDKETRASLQMAYADIAKARQEYPKARAQYEQIALSKDFDDTTAQRQSSLRVAEVDRLTRQYDQAIERLEKLAKQPDALLQAEAFYLLSVIKYDQEEYADARSNLEKVFAALPGHTNARILEGRLHLRMKKLVEATEVNVGTPGSQMTLVPGRPLKVQIEDRTLAVVGQSSAIEVRAWTAAGDEEFFNLLPFGDSKTKFEGQVVTQLGTPVKGDRILQVRGDDTVHYDFSDRFKKANKITDSQTVAIRVVSDGELFVSSGRILTREEQDQLALEQMIRERLRMQGLERESRSLSSVRKANEIKPGNPISVRVMDSDRSLTDKKDKLTVRVTTSSGDRIDRFELEETEGHSGVFEGKVPTQSAPATAFASDTEEGRDPVHVIAKGEHAPWVGQPDNRRPKTFSVDLNRMVELGRMDITAAVAGRRPLRVLVQTSPSGREFETVGAWPANLPGTTSAPWFEVVRFAEMNRLPGSLQEYRDYLDAGYAVANAVKLSAITPVMATNFNDKVNGQAEALGLAADGVNAWYVGRLGASFYLPRRQTCMLRIDPLGRQNQIGYWLLVDGQPSEPRQGRPASPLEITRTLARGVHRVEIFFGAHRRASPAFALLSDVEAPPELQPCSAAMFSPATAPELAAVRFAPAQIVATNKGDTLAVTFAPGTKARTVRLYLADFEGQAPAINRITLTDAAGAAVLPPETDILGLKQNATLEIVPGDRITVAYEDPSPIEKARAVRETQLTATFRNAVVTACTIESFLNQHGVREPVYIPLRRFTVVDSVAVFIEDPDRDTSDQPDKATFRVTCGNRTTAALEAVESEPHSGIFVGRVFPVTAEAARPVEIRVGDDEDLTIVYLDEENTDPGIPWERRATVEQTVGDAPEVRVYTTSSRLLTTNELARLTKSEQAENLRDEIVPVSRTIAALRPTQGRVDNVVTSLLVAPLVMEITHPNAARTTESEMVIYVQTSAGRAKAGVVPAEGEFDIRVPGTVRFVAYPGNIPGTKTPVGYREIAIHGNPYAGDPLDEGRFGFAVPMKLAEVPANSPAVELEKKALAAKKDGEYRRRYERWDAEYEEQFLAVRGDDEIYVGLPYQKTDGTMAWVTRRVRLTADPFLHAMERRYREPVEALHVGETLYLRVINQVLDTTDDKDVVRVTVAASSGASREFQLMETFAHSGVFKGSVILAFSGDAERAQDPLALAAGHGDTVTVSYAAPNVPEPLMTRVLLFKGADGSLAPFTKQFKDPEIAIQTQFTMAEAFFEMAKKHRELGQREVARKEIGQGRKLLEEALRDAPKSEARAHANYLLAELALQFADETPDTTQKNKHFLDAVARFTDIVASYPDSPYAPKAQFKKALSFEKMGAIDQSCEEYVKLSYRYPDNELVAETIARLGQYFLNKNKDLVEQARAQADLVARETLMTRARDMARTAAQVFGRMHERFPDHALAWKTLVLAGQCYMRAEDYEKAVELLERVADEKKAESDLRAQAMYWCGDSYVKAANLQKAYRMFKNLTWNYPESIWAKHARGRLSEEVMAKIEADEAGGN